MWSESQHKQRLVVPAGRAARLVWLCAAGMWAVAAWGATPALSQTAGVPTARAVAEQDPRIPLVQKQVARDHLGALQAVEEVLVTHPAEGQRWGLDYLRGHLLLLLDRRQEALEAFAATLGTTPELHAHSRYRLAIEQASMGHPKVAAGLVATLLGSNPPSQLIEPATRLLADAVSDGGDCRLLNNLEKSRWSNTVRRRLRLIRAECDGRFGQASSERERLMALLEEERGDGVAHLAAQRLARTADDELTVRQHFLLGMTFNHHREFPFAVHHLARALPPSVPAAGLSERDIFDGLYARARSHFWQEQYKVAAAAFGALAGTVDSPRRRAQALYQRARCLELTGDFEGASEIYRDAYLTDPGGQWSDGALISRLRLSWLAGEEAGALQSLERLIEQRDYSTASRALFFLAASDLVQGRVDRAQAWIDRAARLQRPVVPEVAYWRGRLAEARGQDADAVARYAEALTADGHHPFGHASRARLSRPELASERRGLGLRLAGAESLANLHAAWVLLGDGDPDGRRVRGRLEKRLAVDPEVDPFLRMQPTPPGSWPLWSASLRRPEEMLLALGIFDEGGGVVLRHFPVNDPTLAFTGSQILAQSGDTRRSLYVAEILAKRVPQYAPQPLLSQPYRRLLFPFGYSYLVLRECSKRGVDPYLLAAIIREESRYDPRAFSSASARGLTQFVLPTATRIAKKIDIGPITAEDLERPEIAITLGAAYLEELLERFDGRAHQAIAAYNAGEPQAELWQHYCFSDEPEEFYTKVSFRQTRNYVSKVLTSRSHYTELYGTDTTTR